MTKNKIKYKEDPPVEIKLAPLDPIFLVFSLFFFILAAAYLKKSILVFIVCALSFVISTGMLE